MSINLYDIPMITSQQMIRVEEILFNEYGFQPIQMIENAGNKLAFLASYYLKDSVVGKDVLLAVGKGISGAIGLTAARFLLNWGARISLVFSSKKLDEISANQLKILENFPIIYFEKDKFPPKYKQGNPDLTIDALLCFRKNNSEAIPLHNLIEYVNLRDCPVVSLDIPSGLNPVSGKPEDACIKADATLTIGLPLASLFQQEAQKKTGDLFLADIGIPASVYVQAGLDVQPVFNSEFIIDLRELQGVNRPGLTSSARVNEKMMADFYQLSTAKCERFDGQSSE